MICYIQDCHTSGLIRIVLRSCQFIMLSWLQQIFPTMYLMKVIMIMLYYLLNNYLCYYLLIIFIKLWLNVCLYSSALYQLNDIVIWQRHSNAHQLIKLVLTRSLWVILNYSSFYLIGYICITFIFYFRAIHTLASSVVYQFVGVCILRVMHFWSAQILLSDHMPFCVDHRLNVHYVLQSFQSVTVVIVILLTHEMFKT